MAIYVAIRKIVDAPTYVDYTFGASDGPLGILRLDKVMGRVTLIEPLEEDSGNRLYARAAHKIEKHWAAGEYPDRTCWAS